MHFNIQELSKPTSTFASRFVLPLWQYIVPPPKPSDEPYVAYLDFSEGALNAFVNAYSPKTGDTLEVFVLRRRVKLIGAQVEVINPTPLFLTPTMNSGYAFDVIDTSVRSDRTYLLNGGLLDRNTDISKHSVVIDDPDFFGFVLGSGAANLNQLNIKLTLSTTDKFSAYDPTNSAKDREV